MPNSKRGFDDFASDQGPISQTPAATQPAPKKPCYARIEYRPQIQHANHRDSGVGKNFHHVPYPLGLMPFDSWALLRQTQDNASSHHFSCPMCRQRRPPPSTHRRRLFLVAERLSWEKGRMPLALLERNQEMTWEVNFQLGIYEPFVEDLDQVPGGKKSRENPVYSSENASDFSLVMLLVTKGEDLTEASYDMWQRLLDIVHYSPGPNEVVETHDCPGPADAPSVHQTSGPKCSLKILHEEDEDDLPTPPGSSQLNPRQPMQRATLSPSNSKKSLEEIGRVIQPTPPPSSQPGSDLPSGIPTEPPGLLAQTPPSSSAGTMPSLTPKREDAGTINEMPVRPPRRTLPEF